jgi:hypothetical protein
MRLIAKRKKGNQAKNITPKILAAFIILAVFFGFFKISQKFWNGKDKFAVVYNTSEGDAAVTVLDPQLGDVTTLLIPGDTQVEIARNYGTIRLKNVWKLGLNEKIGGALLAETVTQNFSFPTFLWGDTSPNALANGKFGGLISFVFSPGKTNIRFGDRLSAAFFSIGISDQNREIIDLGKSQFLTKIRLSDGEMGYILTGPVSQRLTAYFSDIESPEGYISIGINDATGIPGVAENVGRVLEVLGGKVVAVNKKVQPLPTDCEVAGKNPQMLAKIVNLFGCKTTKTTSGLTIELTIGSQFAKRY